SLKWMRNQLFLRSCMLQQTRCVNSWNAFIKARLQDANEGLGRGDHLKLTAFIAENKARLLRDYGRLTVAEKQAYNVDVLKSREAKNCTTRANPKAVKHDMNAAFTSMDHEVRFHYVIVLRVAEIHLVDGSSYERVTLNCQRPLNKLISDCHELIQDELDFFLMEKNVSGKVRMNYTNYEHAIVKCYGVEL
ncbi:hypothetical protein EDB19DRAFT_1603672, partial [Suillus lakei]